MRWLPLILILFLAGCGERQPTLTPRPKAYPRIELYPPAYCRVPVSQQLSLAVNDSAVVDIVSDGWFNIRYPAYGITVNCTLSPYSAEVVANRLDRLDRNLGGSRGEVVSSPRGMVIVAPAALRTPVQLLATDSVSWVLSAVAVSDFPPGTATDSVSPVINAVASDMITLLEDL